MLKKILTGTGIVAVLAVVFLLGSLAVGPIFAQSPDTANSAEDDVNEQNPQYTGSIQIDDAKYEGMNGADEAVALQGLAKISAADAEAAALAANPGATVTETELDNENGTVVYSVELSNGSEVKVDAGTGAILHTEANDD